MNIDKLVPAPARREAFRRNREKFIPEGSGCYILTNFAQDVMYIGLATRLRRRFIQHLDSPSKVAPTIIGRAVLFWWLESIEISKIERTWINIYLINEGKLPVLNKINSPVAI